MPKPLNNPFLESIIENPLMINATSQALFQASIESICADENLMALVNKTPMVSASDEDDFWGDPDNEDDWLLNWLRPYNVVNGVLQIPVQGTLLDRFPWQFGRWATGYKYIEMAIKRGLRDAAVTAIALIIDSPGGEVSGCFELCEKIVAANDNKPIRAFAANSAYSAAYAIASSTSQISVTKGGGVGSIGVVTAHVDYSEALDKAGVKVTFIFAGKHKVDGNSYEKLPKAVKDRIQTRINKIYGVFTSTVSANRGMDEDDVRATEALCYDADEALEIGLADRIGALDEELAAYAAEFEKTGDLFMAIPQGNLTGQKPGTTDANGIDQATYEKGVADAKAEGHAEGLKAGATAERTRVKAIIESDEGKERPKAALAAALNSSMSAEEAIGFLALTDKEAPAKAEAKDGKNGGRNMFAEAMNGSEQPNVGTEGGDESAKNGGGEEKADSNFLLGAFATANGMPAKKAK